MKRIINANKFGVIGELRELAEQRASRRDFRVYETTSNNPDGWRAVETTETSGPNNWPGLEFTGPQPEEIEAILERCC